MCDALFDAEQKIKEAMKCYGDLVSDEDRERLAKIIHQMLVFRFRPGYDLSLSWTPEEVANAIAAHEAESND